MDLSKALREIKGDRSVASLAHQVSAGTGMSYKAAHVYLTRVMGKCPQEWERAIAVLGALGYVVKIEKIEEGDDDVD